MTYPVPHYVYRVYDQETGELLYVGCTTKVRQRLLQHVSQGSPLGQHLTRWRTSLSVESYPDKRSGYAAERRGIYYGAPRYNTHKNAGRFQPVDFTRPVHPDIDLKKVLPRRTRRPSVPALADTG